MTVLDYFPFLSGFGSSNVCALKVDVHSIWVRRALAVLAGMLMALALPKPNVAGLAWLAPGLLLFAARAGKSFRLGFIAGITHYLISLSWLLHIPVKYYPILGWIALAAYLAIYPATWAWLCSRIIQRYEQSTWSSRLGVSLLCAIAWVAVEMVVCRMFSGFPWNLVGSTQYRMLPLIQIASWTGVYGISFLVVWFSVSLVHAADAAIRVPERRQLWLREIALPMLVAAVTYAAGWHTIAHLPRGEKSIRIGLVQPSIPQTMIWDEKESGTRFAELLRLSNAALTNKPDLLVWPEAAVPRMVRDDTNLQHHITSLARSNNVWIIIGSDDFDFRGTNVVVFNSSFLVSPRGELASTYRKRRLVIFGEYIPLIDWLPFIKYLTPIEAGFAAGEKPVPFELGENGPRTSVLICFEDTFAHYALEHATEDIDFLVNITNDGWFGESAEQWQHAANAVFRAVENRLPLVRCSNNGITCWIDKGGAIRDLLVPGVRGRDDVYSAGFKVIDLPINSESKRAPTFYTRHGDWFGWTCVSVTAPVAVLAWRRRRLSR